MGQYQYRRYWPTSMLCRVSFSLLNVVRHPLISQCMQLYDIPGTQNVGLPTQYRFNVGPALQPIAGSIPVNRIRRWPNIKAELCDCPVFALTALEGTDALSPERPLPGKHDTLAQL